MSVRFFGGCLIGLAATLLTLEIYVRLGHIAGTSTTEIYNDIGRGRRANMNYLFFNEGLGIGRFNNHRFIGNDVEHARKPNSLRIAILGDSYVEGFQVLNRHHFCYITEKVLSEQLPSYNVEVLNFGRSGFNLVNMIAYQKLMVDSFNPDLVIYMVSPQDLDIKNSDPLLPTLKHNDGKLTVEVARETPRVASTRKYARFQQQSAILNMLGNCLRKTRTTPILRIVLDKYYLAFKSIPTNESTPNNHKYQPKLDSIIRLSESVIKADKVVLINRDTIPWPIEFQDALDARSLTCWNIQNGLDSLREHGINPNYWDAKSTVGHWNMEAHQEIGVTLAQNIKLWVTNNKAPN